MNPTTAPAPDVSIVVPFMNAEASLERCLRALLEQEVPDLEYEILVVDNGSTDRSAAIAEANGRVRLLREPERGSYRARNLALRAARGSLIAFTDADCIPRHDWLMKLVEAFRDQGVKIVLGCVEADGNSLPLQLFEAYEREKADVIFNSDVADLYYGYTNNMAVRRSVFEELGAFRERQRGADSILVQRVIDRFSCNAVASCPSARVRHLQVRGLLDCYRKKFVYGRSTVSNRDRCRIRPLGPTAARRLFRRLSRQRSVTAARMLLLVAVVAAGRAAFDLGRIAGFLSPRS